MLIQMFGRNPYRPLEAALGYRFRDRRWLEQALTHPSYRHETSNVNWDNQRLEFLGDATIALLTARWLFETFPNLPEGELTRRRAALTRASALAEVGRRLGVASFVRLGRGETKSGGPQRAKILEDCVEALVGAALMDGGLRAAQRIFERTLLPMLLRIVGPLDADDNPKGRLTELCQQRRWPLPAYAIASESGLTHDRWFEVEVRVGSHCTARGTGRSKKEAEKAAAREALRIIESQPGSVAPGRGQ